MLINLAVPNQNKIVSQNVAQYLQLDDPKKRAYNLYIAGLTYQIYSGSEECSQYSKRKVIKDLAIKYLEKAISVRQSRYIYIFLYHNYFQLDPKNPFCLFTLSQIYAEVGDITISTKHLEQCLLLKSDISGAIALQIILLISQSEINEAYMVVVNWLKKNSQNRSSTFFYLLKYDNN